MGFIKTDPSQTKTVIALLGILGVALGVTIVRINPSPQVAKAAAEQTQAESAAKPGANDALSYDRSRNPFQRPASIKAMAVASAGPHRSHGPWGDGGSVQVDPITIGPIPDLASDSAKHAAPGKSEREMESGTPSKPEDEPTFHLLATMSGDDGFSAVIRCGDKVRVVEVGDTLDGGYRVSRLEDGQAVLSDGRNTLVAKRPRS